MMLKPLSVAVALSSIIATIPPAQAATFTLVSSASSVQVSTGLPVPNNNRTIANFGRSEIIAPDLGGTATADPTAGTLKASASTVGLTDPFGDVIDFSVTSITSMSYSFRYNGVAPLTLGAGALAYTVDALFDREFTTATFDGNPISTSKLTQFTSSFSGVRGVQGRSETQLTVVEGGFGLSERPINSASGDVDIDVARSDADGVNITHSNRAAVTLADGAGITFSIRMAATAQQVGFPDGFRALPTFGATVDATNTGRLSLVLPEGVEVVGFDTAPTWITTGTTVPIDPVDPVAPVPLPASAWLAFSALVGLRGLRLGRRRT